MTPETPLQTEAIAIAADCKSCNIAVNVNDQFCQGCGYPLKGTEEEQQQFIYNRDYKYIELDSMNNKIRSARNCLFVLAALFTVSGFIYYLINTGAPLASALLLTNLILAAIFLALGFWAPKRPVAAIISGLVLYVLVILINAIDNPLSIFSGVIVKVFVIIYLIKGMNSAFEAERIRKQLNIS
jgi:hypothetical protein